MRSHILTLFQTSNLEAENEKSQLRQAEISFGFSNRNRRNRIDRPNPKPTYSNFHELPVSKGSYDDLWLDHENHWRNFSNSPPGEVCFDMIPFPPCDNDVLEFTAKLNSLDRNMKAAYRLACKRFHPDKFMQTFGSHIAIDDAERILSRLTSITQAINDQYASCRKFRRKSSEPPR